MMRLDEREIHGLHLKEGAAPSPKILREKRDTVVICGIIDVELTAADARHLARKLNRLALRIEKRAAQAIEARRAETHSGSVHESAVGNADASNPSGSLQDG